MSSIAQVPHYTQECMFLQASLDLPPVSLLANLQLETPFLYPENHRNILPSWLSRERTTTRYYRRWFQGCLRQPRQRKKKPGQMPPLRKNLPQHAQDLTCAAKLTHWEERRFIGPFPRALCQPKPGRENPAKFLCQGKTLPSTHRI